MYFLIAKSFLALHGGEKPNVRSVFSLGAPKFAAQQRKRPVDDNCLLGSLKLMKSERT